MPAISIYLPKGIYYRLQQSPDGDSKTIQKALAQYLPPSYTDRPKYLKER